jgi:hypothetical protein
VADNGGFVIVSGDDRTDAILGYSDRGSFDEESVPENFRAWLVQMESEIASLPEAATRAVDSAPTAAFRKVATHARIRPLIITTWNQGNYNNAINSDGVYNCHLPMIDGQYPCTGCVAVVGAQLMYYYRWPQAATQEVSGYASSLAATNNALPPIQFQWDKMKTSYYPGDPDAEAVSAVADLLLYSAYAANMEFGVDGSASSTYTLAQGLCSYFDYDPNSWREVQRSNYSVSQWDELIYNELANGRPVIYNGSYKGGHAFICDGYDGEGMYHFNWGWGGAYNGYFKLQATNPFGSNNIKNSGYIADNNCIIGLQPSSWPEITYQDAKDTWEVPETFGPVPTTLDVVITNSTVEWFSWNNYPSANTFRCGIGELNGDGTIELLSFRLDRHSVLAQHLIQRCQRPLREPSLHEKNRLRTQRAAERQKKPQRGAALPAGKLTKPARNSANGIDRDSLALAGNLCAEGVQAIHGRSNIGGNPVTADLRLSLPQRSADQQSVRL